MTNESKVWKKLKNAPIHEAVIEIRLAEPYSGDVKNLMDLYDKISDKYQKKQLYNYFALKGEFSIELAEVKKPSMESEPHGIRCESEDGKHVVQFIKDKFVFSRLAPYETWEAFEKEAKRLWHFTA